MKFKRAISILMSLILIFSLAACTKGAKKDKADPNVMDIGEYRVEYLGSQIVSDKYVSDVIAVNLKYTNNGKEAKSFESVVYYKLTQGDSELEYAPTFLSDDSDDMWDDSCSTEVKPGESLEVYITYKLIDFTTKVKVEFSDLMDKYVETIEIDPSTLQRAASNGTAKGNDSKAEGTASVTEEEALEWWNGDWYGWWIIDNARGEDCEGLEGKWWDCGAEINIDENGKGTILFWDEDNGRDASEEDRLGLVDISLKPDEGGSLGTVYSEKGFFFVSELKKGEWKLDPDAIKKDFGLDDFLEITGSYEDGENGFDYTIYIRPWGTIWDDDVSEKENFPYHYEDWYLPLVEAGEDMPDEIGK